MVISIVNPFRGEIFIIESNSKSKQMKSKETISETRRALMIRAWALFRRGVLSMSLSLTMSWQVTKGKITEKQLMKQLFKKGPYVSPAARATPMFS